MITSEEKEFFLQNGYLLVREVLKRDEVSQYQAWFEEAWKAAGGQRCNQHELLKHKPFIELIERPAILDRHRAIFGNQTQLLQYDLLRQGPQSKQPDRGWHRDFVFPGDRPLSINTILYFDDMTEERGPTRVVPRSHRGDAQPPTDMRDKPMPGEVAAYANAGDAVFINSSIWHSGGCNKTDGLRRGAYLYYGYWWLKRYESNHNLPWQAFENASEQRLRLLGVKMPDRDIHMYDPTR